eukprot:Rhum_TRINITY_DN14420_c6_g1::Rhum_TRINITY_DN14420_c6_g1_i2::g.89477::m.89477
MVAIAVLVAVFPPASTPFVALPLPLLNGRHQVVLVQSVVVRRRRALQLFPHLLHLGRLAPAHTRLHEVDRLLQEVRRVPGGVQVRRAPPAAELDPPLPRLRCLPLQLLHRVDEALHAARRTHRDAAQPLAARELAQRHREELRRVPHRVADAHAPPVAVLDPLLLEAGARALEVLHRVHQLHVVHLRREEAAAEELDVVPGGVHAAHAVRLAELDPVVPEADHVALTLLHLVHEREPLLLEGLVVAVPRGRRVAQHPQRLAQVLRVVPRRVLVAAAVRVAVVPPRALPPGQRPLPLLHNGDQAVQVVRQLIARLASAAAAAAARRGRLVHRQVAV